VDRSIEGRVPACVGYRSANGLTLMYLKPVSTAKETITAYGLLNWSVA